MTAALLNLSRNLGLITGASAMGMVFAWATAAKDVASAAPEALSVGLVVTFSVAAVLVLLALASQVLARRAG
ncbi:hypothetical protein FQZ97_981210 [compost metagenome]